MIRCIRCIDKVLLLFVMALSFTVKAETVDVMFLYDDYSEQRLSGSPNTAFINWVDEANAFYRDSQVDIQLRVVGALKFNMADNDMGRLLDRYSRDRWVNEQRAALGADIVSYVHQSGNCGVGYFAVHRDWAFNVIGTGHCGGAMVLAHEIGHNMGLAHSRLQGDRSGARYAYGLGHGRQNSFGTIMTYAYLFNGVWMPVFSNPNLDCDGDPCGVPEGQAEQADAAKALNNVRAAVAAYVPTRVVDTGGNDTGGTDTGGTDTGGTDTGGTDTGGTDTGGTDTGGTDTGGTDTGGTDTGVVADGVYAMLPVHSGKCIDVYGAHTSANERIIQWQCHYQSNQQWKFTHKNNDIYEIRAMHSGLCMAVPKGSASNGVIIRQEQCSGGDSQLWAITAIQDGSYSLKNVASGKSLDIKGVSRRNLADVIQWSYWNGPNQRFRLAPQ